MMGSMIDKDWMLIYDADVARIERIIDGMSEEELKKWCKDNLIFYDDYGADMWIIYVDFLDKKESGE